MNFEQINLNESQDIKANLQKVIDDLYFKVKRKEIVLPDTQNEDFIREAQKLDKNFARNLPARGLEGAFGPDIVDDFKKLKNALENDFQGQFWGSFYYSGVEEEKQPAGFGYPAKSEGFMLIGTPDRDFSLENLSAVLVPRQYESTIEALKLAYPGVRFITIDDIKDLPVILGQS